MSDQEVLIERLEDVLELLERIPRRFRGIARPADFQATDEGVDRMDAICMILIAAGEEFKKIDRKTNGELFRRYPQADWRGAIRVRDVMAHGYLDADVDELFSICRDDIPSLIDALRTMIADLRHGAS